MAIIYTLGNRTPECKVAQHPILLITDDHNVEYFYAKESCEPQTSLVVWISIMFQQGLFLST